MKKLLFRLLLALCWVQARAQTDPAYPAAPLAAQNVVAAEYFLDADPGLGNGTAISVAAAVNIGNAAASINTAGLTNGVHRVYIRTRSAEGNWSMTNVKDFIVDFDPVYPAAPVAALNVVAAEYFIDTDPGLGNGTAIPITPSTNLSNVAAAINTAGLTNGVHRAYFRTRSAEGNWSMTNVKDFIVDFDPAYPAAPVAALNVIAAEYFIDTDPGLGNGTAISITPSTNLNNVPAAISTAGLTNGVHRVYIRTRSAEGNWSLTNVKDFTVDTDPAYPVAPAAALNVIAAEYFIDTDPGLGNGSAIPITPGTNITNITAGINTFGLTNGVHRVYIRTKSAEGNWSLTNVKDFTVDIDPAYPAAPVSALNVVAAEYFIDTDPGLGNGTAISITPGTNLSNVSVAVNTSGLAIGKHYLYLRTLSGEGNYSLTNVDTFLVSNPLSLDLLSFTAAGSGNDVLLHWTTDNETQTSCFDVEYSIDARRYEQAGNVQAQNIPGRHEYGYTHVNAPQAIVYYRLKQTDKNGSYTYSKTVSVNMQKDTRMEVGLYPNPADNTLIIQNLRKEEIASLEIISANGKTAMHLTVKNDMQYDVSQLPQGVYYLRLMKKDGIITHIGFVKR